MKFLNHAITPILNSYCVILYLKNSDKMLFYCSSISHDGDGKYRFYIRVAWGDVPYRIVLKESDFLFIHVIIYNGGSYRLHHGALVELTEYKLIHDCWGLKRDEVRLL